MNWITSKFQSIMTSQKNFNQVIKSAKLTVLGGKKSTFSGWKSTFLRVKKFFFKSKKVLFWGGDYQVFVLTQKLIQIAKESEHSEKKVKLISWNCWALHRSSRIPYWLSQEGQLPEVVGISSLTLKKWEGHGNEEITCGRRKTIIMESFISP